MKIQMKKNFKIIFFILFSTFIYAEDINQSLNLALKDSLVDISKIDSKFQNQPEYMFLNALIDTDGESAKSKFTRGTIKFATHQGTFVLSTAVAIKQLLPLIILILDQLHLC